MILSRWFSISQISKEMNHDKQKIKICSKELNELEYCTTLLGQKRKRLVRFKKRLTNDTGNKPAQSCYNQVCINM